MGEIPSIPIPPALIDECKVDNAFIVADSNLGQTVNFTHQSTCMFLDSLTRRSKSDISRRDSSGPPVATDFHFQICPSLTVVRLLQNINQFWIQFCPNRLGPLCGRNYHRYRQAPSQSSGIQRILHCLHIMS